MVRVKVDGSGDAGSLEEAARLVQPGGAIQLEAGTYRLERPLELTTDLRLIGAGMDKTRLVADGEGFVLRVAGTGRYEIRGITLEHVGENWANVLEVAWENVLIEQCRFVGGKWDSTYRGGAGLWIHGQSWALVRECIAEENARFGIEVSEQAQPTLEKNLCRNNEGSGVLYFGNSAGLARENTCEGNEYHGIQVGKQAQPTLENNLCRNIEQVGILYFGSSAGVARENTCEGNKDDGIWVSGTAKPSLEGNFCRVNAAGQLKKESVWELIIVGAIGGAMFGAASRSSEAG